MELAGQQMESVSVTFKCDQIAPLLREHGVLEFLAFAVLEEAADGVFSGMAERWITEVVSEANRGDDGLDVGLVLFQLVIGQFLNGPASYGSPDASHFQTMGQAVVDYLASREGKHLCLVLQSAERA